MTTAKHLESPVTEVVPTGNELIAQALRSEATVTSKYDAAVAHDLHSACELGVYDSRRMVHDFWGNRDGRRWHVQLIHVGSR